MQKGSLNYWRILFVVFLCFCFQSASAQGYGRSHPFDFKKFNLGFLMGLNYNAYNLKEQVNIWDQTRSGDSLLLREVSVNPQLGISLGMITNLNIHENISLRFIPTISLEQRTFDYEFEEAGVEQRKIEASYLNLPFMVQWKSKYYKAVRAYVLTGAQLGVNLASNKKVKNDEKLLKISTQDISLVFGIGFNIYGDRIKLSPELRYSMGLIDIYEPKYTTHEKAIGHLFSQVITFNINFE